MTKFTKSYADWVYRSFDSEAVARDFLLHTLFAMYKKHEISEAHYIEMKRYIEAK